MKHGILKKNRCLIIAEIAQAHDGSLGLAHSMIDAAAKAGADAIKFQTHIAEEESSPEEPWRIKFSYEDKTRFDYWKRMEFTKSQWQELRDHAHEKNLLFVSSPFSLAAVDLLRDIQLDAWKIASGEVSNSLLLKEICKDGRTVLISSGMSNIQELSGAVEVCKSSGAPVGVMQCTSAYPCPPEKIGLNVLKQYQELFSCPVGLSDHSGTIFASLAAASLGAQVVEVHVTFSKDMFGPDTKSSITFEELKTMTEGIRFIEKMNSSEIDKNNQDEDILKLRGLFTKSIALKSSLKAGELLTEENITLKKPGSGLNSDALDQVLGKRLKENRPAGHFLVLDDLEVNS